MKHRLIARRLVLAGLSVWLAACTAVATPAPEPPASSESAATVEGPAERELGPTETLLKEASAPAATEVQVGGVVRRGVGAGPQKIFPPSAAGGAEFVPMDHIFSRLIACRFYGRFDCPTQEWVGDLAESWEVSGPNDSVWVFHLHENATWHDGQPVTADDVLFTWQYDLLVPGGSQITCPLAEGMGLLGATQFCEGQADTISGITKVDDYTVQFDFDPELVAVERPSSWQNVWIIPKHIWEGIDPETAAQSSEAQNPIGSGPFKFVQHLTDQYIELERNEQYYLGSPRLEKIFLVIGAADARCNALETGELDATSINLQCYERVKNLDNIRVYRSESSFFGIFFNYAIERMRDPRLHQAVRYAIDTEKILQEVYPIYLPAKDIMQISTFMPADELNRLDRYSYDPEKAKALLAEMGWDSSVKVKTLATAVPAGDPIQVVIIDMLKAVGIEVETFSTTALADLFYGEDKEDWEMIIPPMSGIGPYADCTGFHIYPRWHSQSASPWQYYSNPRIDEIIDQVATLPIGPERVELCSEFDDLLTEELPGVPLYYTVDLFAVNSRMHYGIPYGEQEHLERFDLWWIEQ